MTSADSNHLELLAFRYIANEMAMDEREAFENRLADDQAACEAVAAAVEMAQALALTVGEIEPAIVSITVPARKDYQWNWLRPAAWMSAGAAACLVAVLISQTIRSQGDRLLTNSAKLPSETSADRLALVWSQIRQPETADEVRADDSRADEDSSPVDDTESTASDTMVSTTSAVVDGGGSIGAFRKEKVRPQSG